MPDNLFKRTKAIVCDPIHRLFCAGPTAYVVKTELKVGETLMEKVGADPHAQAYTFLDADDVPSYKIQEQYFGYWQHAAAATVFVIDQWRGEIPVWSFMLQGSFSQPVCAAKDQTVFDAVQDILQRSASLRRTDVDKSEFTPRGHTLLMNDSSYHMDLHGTWDSFTGYERIFLNGREVWTASFMGQYLKGASI